MTQLRRPPPSQTNPFASAESAEVERKAVRPTQRRRRCLSGGAGRAKNIRESSWTWSWIWTISHNHDQRESSSERSFLYLTFFRDTACRKPNGGKTIRDRSSTLNTAGNLVQAANHNSNGNGVADCDLARPSTAVPFHSAFHSHRRMRPRGPRPASYPAAASEKVHSCGRCGLPAAAAHRPPHAAWRVC